MRVSIFSISVLVAIAALALLLFSISVPRSSARYEAGNAEINNHYYQAHIEELADHSRRLSSRLEESEALVAQWEESWRRGETPQYYRERMKKAGYLPGPGQERFNAPGRARNSAASTADGRGRAGRNRGGTDNAGPVRAGKAGLAKKDKSEDKSTGTQDGSKAQKKQKIYVGGLLGLYYQGRRFESLKLVMTDYEVDFDFADGSPDRIMLENNFSIRWLGYVKVDRETKYTFRTLSDDGVRLWISGHPVINNWGDHAGTFNSGSMRLKKGYHALRLDFYENGGVAAIKLYWSSDRFPMEIIPPANLYHDPEREEKARKELR